MLSVFKHAKRTCSKFSLAALSLNIVGSALLGLTPVQAAAATFPKPTTVAVVTSGTPSTVGDSVTFTATVTKTYGLAALLGTVTFKDGATTIGTKILPITGGFTNSKQVTLTTSSLTVGTHPITASFDSSFGSILADSDSSSIDQVVNPTSSTVVVNPNAMENWIYRTSSTGIAKMAFGPATAPLGDGSTSFTVGTDGDSRSEISNTGFNGTKLSDLTELKYYSYTSHDGSGGQSPYIILVLDYTDDGITDDQITFEPEYQNGYTFPVVQADNALNTWQEWDALNGGWWSDNNTANAGPGTDVKSISDILAAHPNATIVNKIDGVTVGGLRVQSGVGAGAWDLYTGNVDQLTIGVAGHNTVYDFEPLPVAPCIPSNSFDTFTDGSVNGQDGWSVTGAYDQQIVPNNYGYPTFGCKSFRLSNAVTSGGFGDQTFSVSNANEAGETTATNHGMSGGARQKHFDATFDIASTQATQQTGLNVSVSPDRGDGSRMSYLRFDDNAGGIDVTFFDVQGTTSPANFVSTVIATGLSRTTPHTIRFSIDYVDGPSNDVVKIYIDGNLVHTGTTWENYYRFDIESIAEQTTRTTDSLLFRASGTAVAGNSGKGFLFDNFSESSSTLPATVKVTIAKYINNAQATVPTANSSSFSMHAIYPGGQGDYDLSITGFNNPTPYMATTSDMPSGSDYSTYENTFTPCTAVYPFDLVGYTTGDTLTSAEMGIPTMTVPAFTGLTNDKFVIVWNKTCPPAPTHLTPADGSTLTTAQADKIDWTDVTSPAMPISYYYEVATSDTSTNPDGSFVNPVYESPALNVSEIVTAGTTDGTYHYHVRAVDGAGNASAWTTPWTLTVSNTPVPNVCGDGNIAGGEQCDDGNSTSGDGCSMACMNEVPAATFTGFRNQADGNYDNGQPILACGSTTASQYIAFEWADAGTSPSVSYEYKILSGPAGTGYTEVHTNTHHNGGIPTAGTYNVQITPKDALGHTGTPVTCAVTYDPLYVAPVACNVTDTDLLAHWKLDEAASATVATDATTNNNDGSVSGATSAVTGAPVITFANDGAYNFDGINDSIDMGSNVGNVSLAQPFSVSAWINPALDFQNHAIYGNTWSNAGYLLRVTAENKIRFILVENGGTYNGMDSAVLSAGWHHIVGVWTGTQVKVYVDGVESSATPVTNGTVTTISTSAHTFIGSTGQAGAEQFFKGDIDDVRVYGDVLSSTEVAALAGGQCQGGTPTPGSSSASSVSSASSAPIASSAPASSAPSSAASSTPITACTTTALAGYWPMDEGTGTTTFDMTGTGHDGTLQGGTAWASGASQLSPNPFGLSLDGSDDIVNVTSSNDFNYGTQDFTVSAFVRTTTGNRSVLGNFSPAFKGWGLYIYNTNQVNFFGYGSMGNNDSAKPAVVLDGNWHHLVGVYNRTGNDLTIDTYVDGVLVGSSTATVGDISANSTLYFGQYLPQPTLNGGLDDIRIYSRALNAGEVSNLAGGCSNPVIVSSSSSSSVSSIVPPASSSSSSEPTIQTLGLSAPEGDEDNSSHRGNRTNILGGVIKYLTNKIFGNGGTAPGGFGGGPTVPFTDEEKDVICSLKKALPVNPTPGLINWAVAVLAGNLNRTEAQILVAMQDDELCGSSEANAMTKVSSAPIAFHVSSAGFPVSSNATWNACITGKVTLQDIRNNPDKDKHGRGRSCATYHTGNMWTHPDLGIFFTWNPKTKQVSVPTNYALVKDPITM